MAARVVKNWAARSEAEKGEVLFIFGPESLAQWHYRSRSWSGPGQAQRF
jgi:hypothetical protein